MSQASYAAAFDASPIPMAITSLADGRYIEVNDAFVEQIGFDRADVIGRTSLELAIWPTPDDRAAMMNAIREQKTVRNRDVCFRTKSGSLITTRYSATVIEVDGHACVLAAIQDVTYERRAADAILESAAKFRLLAETSPCCICIFRKDGRFCYFNREMLAVTGYSAAELADVPAWKVVHPDARSFVQARIEARFRGDEIPSREKTQIVTKAGAMRWVELGATLIDFDGAPAVLGVFFDITTAKRLQEEALERTVFLQKLVESSPFGILVGGPDHRVHFSNQAFREMFQYAEEEIVGRDPDDLVGASSDDEALGLSQQVLRGRSVHTTTIRRRKDGSKISVELHATPLVLDGAFSGCFAIYQDISERVDSAAKLRTLRSRLTRVQDEERAHVARELHDHTSQQLALLALRLAELKRTSDDVAPSVAEQIDSSIGLVDEIVVDLNRLSRRLHPSQLEYIGLAAALSNLREEYARQSGMAIDFTAENVPDALPAEIVIGLYRVAEEAVRNAVKHSGASRVRIDLVGSAKTIRLFVQDAGRGFDHELLQVGLGLGLVTMAERIESIGGEWSIKSEVDGGTCVEASVPLSHARATV